MKKIFLGFVSFFMILMVSGCGKPKTPDATVKALLKGMVNGEANEVAVKYTTNPSLLISDGSTDVNGLRDAIFSKMTYKVKDVKEYEEDATVTIELKTIDMPSVNFYLKEDLADDENYVKLAGEAKNNYYQTAQVNAVEDAKKDDYYRTVTIEVKVVKNDDAWKVEISNEFMYSVLGQRF